MKVTADTLDHSVFGSYHRSEMDLARGSARWRACNTFLFLWSAKSNDLCRLGLEDRDRDDGPRAAMWVGVEP